MADSMSRVLAGFGRRYPLHRGHSRIATRWLPAPPPGDAIPVPLRCGPRLFVHADEHIGRTVFYFGDLEPKLSWVCSQLLGPGHTVLDVGANYGVITMLAAQAVGPGGCVHAFEPQPGVAELLRRSVSLNGMSQVVVHEVALSDSDGQLELRVPTENLGAASLGRSHDGPSTAFTVDVRSSGAYLASLDLGPIRLLKIDIEGHEPAFLRGARDYLAAAPPDVIVFESNEHVFDSSARRLSLWDRPAVRQIHELGYEIVGIDRTVRSTFVMGLTRLQPGHDDDFGHSLDYVAIYKPKYRDTAAHLGIKDGIARDRNRRH
jgi:FkbM family methyltransferase